MQAEAPPRDSRARRRADRRQEILCAAREVFSKKGYEGACMAEIAGRVGIVEGAIYRHFASKRDLLFECIRDYYAPLVDGGREQLAGIQGTRNRLRFSIWRQLRSFADEPGFCRLIIEEIRPRSDYHESVVRELNRDLTSLVLETVREGIAQGELRGDVRPSTIRDVVFGGIEHLAWKALSGSAPLEVDRLADELTDLIWRGAEVRRRAELGPRAEVRESAELHGGGDPENDASVARLEAQVRRLERALDTMLESRGD
jgi:AcrR family transcriptional regulator